MQITFGVCSKNEGDYLRQLLTRLTTFIQSDKSGVFFNIVVLDDFSTDQETLDILSFFNDKIKLYQHTLNNHFGTHKTYLNKRCSESSIGSDSHFIFQLDADEIVSEEFLYFLPTLIESNPTVDAFWIPRLNTVDGITLDAVGRYLWTITKFEDRKKIKVMATDSDEYKFLKSFQYIISEEHGVITYYEPIIAWPDYQMRLYKANDAIIWVRPVHEILKGYTNFAYLPQLSEYAILHFKDISRQIKQNNFYSQLQKP